MAEVRTIFEWHVNTVHAKALAEIVLRYVWNSASRGTANEAWGQYAFAICER